MRVRILLITCFSCLGRRWRGGDIATFLGLLGAGGKAVNLVLSVLLNEVDKILDGPGAIVFNGGILGTGRIQADGGESGNRIRHIIGSGIDLRNGDLGCEVRDVSIEACELIKFRSKAVIPKLARHGDSSFAKGNHSRLAVPTPWGVELKEDILLIIENKLLIRVSHDDGDWAFLSFGNGLRLDARLNLAVKNILNKFANILGIYFLGLIIGILGVLFRVLNGEGREFLGIKVKVAGMSAEHLRINGSDVDSAPVFLGNRLEVLGELLALFLSFCEDIG